jgi:hypothetical protein
MRYVYKCGGYKKNPFRSKVLLSLGSDCNQKDQIVLLHLWFNCSSISIYVCARS